MGLVQLPKTCSHLSLIEAIDQKGVGLGPNETIAFHLADSCFVTPCTTNCENLVRCARFYNRFCGKVLESRPSGSKRMAS